MKIITADVLLGVSLPVRSHGTAIVRGQDSVQHVAAATAGPGVRRGDPSRSNPGPGPAIVWQQPHTGRGVRGDKRNAATRLR